MTRYEVKLAATASDLPRIRAALPLLPAALRPLHPERIVQSLYFDSPDQAAVADSLAGISQRRKLRVRWYGAAETGVVAQWECKRRQVGVGDKTVVTLPGELAVAGVPHWRFTQRLQRLLPSAEAWALDGQQPVQWVRYVREYLGSADGRLRITIDRDLVAFDQRCSPVLQCRRATPLPPLLVVEAKVDVADRELVERWLQGMPVRPSRCSKFLLATLPAELPLGASAD